MFIELAELLDCPLCARGYGLVAFVREVERRRVLSGRLGCPLCEVEYPIVDGTIVLGAAETAPPEDAPAAAPSGPMSAPDARPDLALRVAALLGLGGDEAPRAVALGPGLASLGPEVARLGGRVEVLCLHPATACTGVPTDIDDLAAGVNPIVGAEGGPWPVRAGALDAVAWQGPLGEAAPRARAAIRPGGRLVLIDPAGGDPARLEQEGFEVLARDDTAWAGARR
jgi:uncharacterized protein YbaR (Trm112 family)